MKGSLEDVAFEVGRCLYQLSRAPHHAEEALECYHTSLKRFGDHHVTLFNVALCQREIGQTEEAMSALEKCLALVPDYDRALRMKQEMMG